MKKILYFVQLPPPRHGVSILNEIICESSVINDGLCQNILPIRFTSNHQDLNKINIKKLFALLMLILRLFWRLLSYRPDIVYFTLTPSGVGFLRDLLFVSVFKIFRVKVMYHLHGVGIAKSILKRPFLKKLYRYTFRNSTIVHLSAGLLKTEIIDHFPEFKENSYSLVNGVDSYKVTEVYSNNSNNILFLSNLKRSKGVFDLLKIFKKIHTEFPNAHLNIAGGSTSKQVDIEIVDTIESLGLTKNITLHGFVDGAFKHELLSQADLFLHPTHDDALPLVLLEAMKYGVPIIATDIGAISEIVCNGENGFVFACGDCSAMAGKSIELLHSPQDCTDISQNSRKLFKEKYSLDIFQKNFKFILKNALK
jgi:glycosyltransferase involved in cell wall biosynthesis